MKDANVIKVQVTKKAEQKADGSKKGKNPAPAEKAKDESAPKEVAEEVVVFTEADCISAIEDV